VRIAVGIDTGGTFTDLTAYDLDSASRPPITLKVPSTPDDPSLGIAEALEVLFTMNISPTDISYLAHGTTVATNAVIEGRLARTAMLTTSGFRDVIELARNRKPDLYDLNVRKPDPIAPRDLRFEIRERLQFDGEQLVPLDPTSVLRAVDAVKASHVDAIAICFLHSFRNPANEIEAKKLLQRELGELPMCTSFEVMPEWREYERFATTLMNAALMPLVGRYLHRLTDRCESMGVSAPPMIMQSNGGLTPVDRAARLPVMTLYSGPSAGVVGAARTADAAGVSDFMTLDVGGTSTDVCLIEHGNPAFVHQRLVAGHMIKVPTVAVQSVGAGGGSIVSIDAGGFLQVGPNSAGAKPGPACYGLGGTAPTITDAHLVLGALDEQHRLGGRVALHADAARSAFAPIAEAMGATIEETAVAALKMMTANISRAIRLVSIDRGHDPRDCSLVAFGGAGPMHAAQVASALEMNHVVVPSSPGILCADGLLSAPIRADYVRTFVYALAQQECGPLADVFRALEDAALSEIRSEGGDEAKVDIRWLAGMNFSGQDHELTVELPHRVIDERNVAELEARFRTEYRTLYGYEPAKAQVRIVNCRVVTEWRSSREPQYVSAATPSTAAPSPIGTRPVYFESSDGFRTAQIYEKSRLVPGHVFDGPAIIEQLDATTIVPPGWHVTVDRMLNLILEKRVNGSIDDH
jgi:N-methylhydantoinase A